MKLFLTLATIFVGVAGASAQRPAGLDELLSLYDRGAYQAFDERLAAFAAAPSSVSAFKRAADRWIEAGSNRERRRLIGAALTVEVAAVLNNWNPGPDFLDAGRNWLRSSGESEAARQWYRAALGAALRRGDADVLLAAEDFGQTFRDPKYRGYSNEALRRFRDDPVLLLFRAIAFEMHWFTFDPAAWLDRDAVERELQSISRSISRGRPAQFSVTARMDLASAERLLRPDAVDLPNVQVVAETSIALWRVAAMFRDLQRSRTIASESTLHLAVTYEQLARPELAARELARPLDSTTSPFVTYIVHFLQGQHFARAGRTENAETAYRLALTAVPGAQTASFALAALLFESGRRAEAERAVAGALRIPPVSDPIKVYGAGDPGHLREALAKLRQELR